MKELKQEFPATIIFLVILLFGAIYLFADSMSTYPSYIHAWTQTDRLALAMNFQENGFDLFHPATYNLLTKDGITQVDFPIHDYLVAIFSAVFKSDMVFTFRLYNLIYSLIGIFFLFRSALLLSKSGKRAVIAAVFIFTLPFYVYYQNGFLPSAPSFSNFLIGLFFLIKYQQKSKPSDFYLSVLFLSFAALSRSPFLIFLVALLGQRVWLQLRAKRIIVVELIPIFIGIAAFIAYYFYNASLAAEYGSMFLSELLYIDSWESFGNVISTAIDRWSKQILSPFHAILLLTFLGFSILGYKRKPRNNAPRVALMVYGLIAFLGVILFFFAMGKQFGDHDYYYIDTLLPLLTLLLLLSISVMQIPKQWYTPIGLMSILFLFYFFSYAKQVQVERYTPPYDDRIEYYYQVYKESKEDLKKWGVTKNDTLVVLDAVSTNMPFTIWENNGYTILNSGEKAASSALDTLNYNYVVLIDSSFVTDSWVDYPNIVSKLDLVNTNGALSIYTKSKTKDRKNFFKNLIHYGESNFDDTINLDTNATKWMKTKHVDPLHKQSYYAPKEYEYFLSFKTPLEKLIEGENVEIMVYAEYLPIEDTTEMQMVLVHGDYYSTHYLQSVLTNSGKWQDKLYRYQIPAAKIKAEEPISFYFWNPEKQELYIDNFKILMYQ